MLSHFLKKQRRDTHPRHFKMLKGENMKLPGEKNTRRGPQTNYEISLMKQ